MHIQSTITSPVTELTIQNIHHLQSYAYTGINLIPYLAKNTGIPPNTT